MSKVPEGRTHISEISEYPCRFFSSVSSPNDRPRQYLLIFLTKGQIDMSVNIFVQLFASCVVVVFLTLERLLDIGIMPFFEPVVQLHLSQKLLARHKFIYDNDDNDELCLKTSQSLTLCISSACTVY